MKPGQLELMLDYPACMGNAVECPRVYCPLNLGEKAKVRCAMAIATVVGPLEVEEIAAVAGEDAKNISFILRKAMRKAGPMLAVIRGEAYTGRRCRVCGGPLPPHKILCSDACRRRARRKSWQAYQQRVSEAIAQAKARGQR